MLTKYAIELNDVEGTTLTSDTTKEDSLTKTTDTSALAGFISSSL